MGLDCFRQGPYGPGRNGGVDGIAQWGPPCIFHSSEPFVRDRTTQFGAMSVVCSDGGKSEVFLERPSTGHATGQLRADTCEGQRFCLESQSKEYGGGVGHGVQQTQRHIEEAEQFRFRMIFSRQFSAHFGRIGNEGQPLEVFSGVLSAILEGRGVQPPPVTFGWTQAGLHTITDIEGAAESSVGLSGRPCERGDSSVVGGQQADDSVGLSVVLNTDDDRGSLDG